jgi:hypothetical protein
MGPTSREVLPQNEQVVTLRPLKPPPEPPPDPDPASEPEPEPDESEAFMGVLCEFGD